MNSMNNMMNILWWRCGPSINARAQTEVAKLRDPQTLSKAEVRVSMNTVSPERIQSLTGGPFVNCCANCVVLDYREVQ